MVSWETITPRWNISPSTSRKLRENRKYSHTQWEITSTGYRCPLYDGDTDDTSDPLPSVMNTKIIPPGQPTYSAPPTHERLRPPGPFHRGRQLQALPVHLSVGSHRVARRTDRGGLVRSWSRRPPPAARHAAKRILRPLHHPRVDDHDSFSQGQRHVIPDLPAASVTSGRVSVLVGHHAALAFY